jgi:hypothetical protein
MAAVQLPKRGGVGVQVDAEVRLNAVRCCGIDVGDDALACALGLEDLERPRRLAIGPDSVDDLPGGGLW